MYYIIRPLLNMLKEIVSHMYENPLTSISLNMLCP